MRRNLAGRRAARSASTSSSSSTIAPTPSRSSSPRPPADRWWSIVDRRRLGSGPRRHHRRRRAQGVAQLLVDDAGHQWTSHRRVGTADDDRRHRAVASRRAARHAGPAHRLDRPRASLRRQPLRAARRTGRAAAHRPSARSPTAASTSISSMPCTCTGPSGSPSDDLDEHRRLIALLADRHIPVVWTAHNLTPHDKRPERLRPDLPGLGRVGRRRDPPLVVGRGPHARALPLRADDPPRGDPPRALRDAPRATPPPTPRRARGRAGPGPVPVADRPARGAAGGEEGAGVPRRGGGRRPRTTCRWCAGRSAPTTRCPTTPASPSPSPTRWSTPTSTPAGWPPATWSPCRSTLTARCWPPAWPSDVVGRRPRRAGVGVGLPRRAARRGRHPVRAHGAAPSPPPSTRSPTTRSRASQAASRALQAEQSWSVVAERTLALFDEVVLAAAAHR